MLARVTHHTRCGYLMGGEGTHEKKEKRFVSGLPVNGIVGRYLAEDTR